MEKDNPKQRLPKISQQAPGGNFVGRSQAF